MIVMLLTEHYLEFLSLKGGCRGSSESTHVKMPHCRKSHAAAQIAVKYRCFAVNDLLPFLIQDKECHIKEVPWRGVNCSDAAGRAYNYDYIIQQLKNSTTGRLWDKASLSPYFHYKVSASLTQNMGRKFKT